MLDWNLIVRRLIKLIDPPGDAYLSGPQFIKLAQQADDDLPVYNEFIEQRRLFDRSTTRRDFFRDILLKMSEGKRVRAMGVFLETPSSRKATRR